MLFKFKCNYEKNGDKALQLNKFQFSSCDVKLPENKCVMSIFLFFYFPSTPNCAKNFIKILNGIYLLPMSLTDDKLHQGENRVTMK